MPSQWIGRAGRVALPVRGGNPHVLGRVEDIRPPKMPLAAHEVGSTVREIRCETQEGTLGVERTVVLEEEGAWD